MPEPTEDRSELYLRFSRRGMAVLLIMIITLARYWHHISWSAR